MTPDSWQRMRDLFDQAKELDPAGRACLLAQTCPAEPLVRVEVEKLLTAHDTAGTFLEGTTVADVAFLRDVAAHESGEEADQPDAGSDYRGLRFKGRYLITEKLAERFSSVYLAQDETLAGKRVVIKVLRPRPEHRQWLERHFRQEAEALARIDHPGVVGVLDYGETPDGKPFLALQFVWGTTLRAALVGQPMPLARVARLLRDLGSALGAAHQKGVCHRDLKPENVMLRDLGKGEEQAVIIDFGIAALTDAESSRTVYTQVAGTLSYMAPEQLLGKASSASDIYALGVMAFEMLTGCRPHEAASQEDVALGRVAERTLAELRSEVPAPARSLIASALSSDPKERPRDARRLGEELATLLLAARPGRTSRKRVLACLAGLVLLAGAITGALWETLSGWAAAWLPRPQPPWEITCALIAGKSRGGVPHGKPVMPSADLAFEKGDQIRLSFESPQDGHLYLINERVSPGPEASSFNVLIPGGSIRVPVGKTVSVPEEAVNWLEFDGRTGREKIWVVWASQPVAELAELARYGNEKYQGAVRDPGAAARLRSFLSANEGSVQRVAEDAPRGRVRVQARGSLLVYPIVLRHR